MPAAAQAAVQPKERGVRHIENEDIHPVHGSPQHAGIRIEQRRNRHKARRGAHCPGGQQAALPPQTKLNGREQQHREEQQPS